VCLNKQTKKKPGSPKIRNIRNLLHNHVLYHPDVLISV